MSSLTTRSTSRHSVFGDPEELCKDIIPLCSDVFKAYLYRQRSNKMLTVKEISKQVAQEVKEIYDKGSIPSIDLSSIERKVQRLIDRGSDLRKYAKLWCPCTKSLMQMIKGLLLQF